MSEHLNLSVRSTRAILQSSLAQPMHFCSVILRRVVCAVGLALAALPALADLAVSATRVVYAEGDFNHTLSLINTGQSALLVQTWVDSGEGDVESAAPFVALPAVLQLNPDVKQTLRIMHSGEPLPQDRESVFWLNLYQIPAIEKKVQAAIPDARVDMALNLQLKVFFRPPALLESAYLDPDTLRQALQFSVQSTSAGAAIRVVNPTAFHVSFAHLGLQRGERELPAKREMDMMLAPFSQRDYVLETTDYIAQEANDVAVFAIIDDAGQNQAYAIDLVPAAAQ